MTWGVLIWCFGGDLLGVCHQKVTLGGAVCAKKTLDRAWCERTNRVHEVLPIVDYKGDIGAEKFIFGQKFESNKPIAIRLENHYSLSIVLKHVGIEFERCSVFGSMIFSHFFSCRSQNDPKWSLENTSSSPNNAAISMNIPTYLLSLFALLYYYFWPHSSFFLHPPHFSATK